MTSKSVSVHSGLILIWVRSQTCDGSQFLFTETIWFIGDLLIGTRPLTEVVQLFIVSMLLGSSELNSSDFIYCFTVAEVQHGEENK